MRCAHQKDRELFLTELKLCSSREVPEHQSVEETSDALLAQGTPAAAARLDDIARSTDDKEVRKAARRALFKLSQRGILPPVAELAQKPAGEAARVENMRAWASAYDGAGNRLFILVLAGEDGGAATVAQLLGNDELGLRNLTLERRRRRELMPLLERLEGRIDEGLAVAEIEADYARWLLDRFREVNVRRSTTSPDGFLDLLPRIGAASGSYDVPPVYAALEAEDSTGYADAPPDPDEFFKLVWFDPWFFAVEDVIPWLDRCGRRSSGDVGQDKAGPQARDCP